MPPLQPSPAIISTGTVCETLRPCRRITLVRLTLNETTTYRAGQYLPVSSPTVDADQWRMLSPALPVNPDRQIEFHIKHDPVAKHQSYTGRLALAQPGDIWHFGAPQGEMTPSESDSGIVLVCSTTGLAPMRAIILQLAMSGALRPVHLFVGASYPGELYDMGLLWQIASQSPWLQVQPVVTHDRDEWWVGATNACQAPPGFPPTVTGFVGKVAADRGPWMEEDVLVAGSPTFTEQTRAALRAGGTPPARIISDPY